MVSSNTDGIRASLRSKDLGPVLSRDRESGKKGRIFTHKDDRPVVQSSVVALVEGLPATSDKVLNNLF